MCRPARGVFCRRRVSSYLGGENATSRASASEEAGLVVAIITGEYFVERGGGAYWWLSELFSDFYSLQGGAAMEVGTGARHLSRSKKSKCCKS